MAALEAEEIVDVEYETLDLGDAHLKYALSKRVNYNINEQRHTVSFDYYRTRLRDAYR
jgi:hypothetical protein